MAQTSRKRTEEKNTQDTQALVASMSSDAGDKQNAMSRDGIDTDEIAALAYQKYVARGYEDGHAEEDWYAAEQELKAGQKLS